MSDEASSSQKERKKEGKKEKLLADAVCLHCVTSITG